MGEGIELDLVGVAAMVERYKRHNWNQLLHEFVLGKYSTLKQFAEIKGLNYKSSQFFVNTKGWIKIKERININPKLYQDYETDLHRIIDEMPYHFFNCRDSTIQSAAFTFICDNRKTPCTIDEIAKWYDININEVDNKAKKERWIHYRRLEACNNFGMVEYLEIYG